MFKKTFWLMALVLAVGGCGAPEEKTLRLLIWQDYLSPDVAGGFEMESGARLTADAFASNDEALRKLEAGESYDIALVPAHVVSMLARQNRLAALDHGNIPNLTNLDPGFRSPAYDKDNRYSVAYAWGVSGVGYSRSKTAAAGPPASWGDFFNPAKLQDYRGKVSLQDDMREAIGAALIYKGHSPNSKDPAALEAARAVLAEQGPFLAKLSDGYYVESLLSGTSVLGQAWSGDIIALQGENPDLEFAVPKEGSLMFVDNLVIPRGVTSKGLAESFINYLLRADMAAKNANYLGYPTANQAAQPMIDRTVPGVAYQLPKDIVFHRLEDVGDAADLYKRVWDQVRAK